MSSVAAAVRPLVELIGLRGFHPAACAHILGGRQFALAAGSSSGGEGEEEAPAVTVDTKYRSATEVLWPASKHQERFASRLHNALSTVLISNARLRDTLVNQLGFAVRDVRMSPDNLKAFIQWDSLAGQPAALDRELRKQTPQLRAAVARALRARNVPVLVFKHDGLTEQQQRIEDIFQRLDEEEQEDQQQQQQAPQRQPRQGPE